MTNNTNAVSPAKANEQLQLILNETALAPNYLLEKKTTDAFSLLLGLSENLPENEEKLTSYYRLFNAWIRWLADWDHFSLNLLHRRRLLGHLNRRLGQGKFSLQIYPYTTRLYNISAASGNYTIQLHECMDYMSDSDCGQFARFIAAHRWKDLRAFIADYRNNTPRAAELAEFFSQTKAEKEPENQTRGKFYDLETVFRNCNLRNFGGKMARPRGLHWSARVNHSTMGSYNLKEDTVMINRGLDRRDVPAYVLDFVMYHELLHKLLGIQTSGTRHRSHTPQFRRLEQAHPDYAQAQAFIQKNASRL